MSLITQSLASLVNGVSQQPAILRLQSQAERQVNCVSSAVDGVRRRPPTQHIAKVASGNFADATVHLIDRDATEKYAVVVTNGDLRVFDARTGAERSVIFPDGKAYLTASGARRAFKGVTVADHTYLVNREVAVGMTPDRAPTRPPEGIIFFRAADYREHFTIELDGHRWRLGCPPSANNDNTRGFILTDNIAAALATLLATGSVPGAGVGTDSTTNWSVWEGNGQTAPSLGYAIAQVGSVIHVSRPDGQDFNLTVRAGGGGDHMVAFKGSVSRFTELPREAVDGFTIKVEGDPDDTSTSYWVKYVRATAAPPVATLPEGGNTGGTTGGSGTYPGVTPGGGGNFGGGGLDLPDQL